ncbi:MAG: xanthine dehydrogenase family protein molybdopterin-binding subunit [Synergistes sp.]|nr:xanthine dehydrogenase family protein molybdopterin-binding subunit [Synergistes sp.]
MPNIPDVHYEKGNYSVVGTKQPYIDAYDKVTGRTTYISDFSLPGMLFGKALRSPYPHARILSIDTSAAEKVPGIKCVLTGKNVQQYKWGPVTKDEYLLAVDKANFTGDEVAAVAGVDEEACDEALSKIKVEYEPLPAILNMHDAMKEGAPLIHEEFPRNVNCHFDIPRGDFEAVAKNAYLVHEGEYETSLEYQSYIEPMAGVSTWDRKGNVTIYAGIQTPTWSRNDYAVALGIPVEKVRIVQMYFGGGFGAKLSQQVHPLGALIAKYAEQPVRFVMNREEDFQCGLPRVPMYFKIKTAWSKEGKYLGKYVYILADNGAYGSYGIPIGLTAMYRIDIMYQVPVVHSVMDLVYTNKVPTGCFRGFGNTQMHLAHETHIDEVAEMLGIAPDELRIRNFAGENYKNPHGWKTNSCEVTKCMVRAVEKSDYHAKAAEMAKENETSPDIKKGIGVAAAVHVSGNRSFIKPFEGAGILLRMNEQGKVYVLSNEPDMGQGIRTVLTMCVAEGLKLDPEHICVPDPDSNVVPFGLGCFASRGTYMATGAIHMALNDMKAKLIKLAAELLSLPEDELDLKDGAVVSVKDPSKKATYAELAWKHVCDFPGQNILGIGYFTPAGVEYPDATKYNNISGGYAFGADVAEVEVNVKTGQIKVSKIWGVHDVGQPMNLLALEGQLQGGIAMGYGWAVMEHLKYNEKGRVANAGFLDYQIPTSADIPEIDVEFVDSFEWTTGFGAKSIGENSLNPTAPAILNAISNAIGIRFYDLPVTAEKVLKALKEKAKASGAKA